MTLNKIHIYHPSFNNRVKYIFDFIFESVKNCELVYYSDLEIFRNSSGIKLNYSNEIFDEVVTIPMSNYFNDSVLPDFTSELESVNKIFSFDFIAVVFHLICRVEEYNSKALDEHLRYKSSASILHRKGILDKPVIDYWIRDFIKVLSDVYNSKFEIAHQYKVVSTVDIDHIYAFKSKPLLTQLGSTAKDIATFNIQRLKDRSKSKDPFDTYDYIQEVHDQYGLACKYFILTSNRTKYDRSLPTNHPDFIEVIKKIANSNSIGIHPSYDSYKNKDLILSQKINLESVIDQEINSSRQHFLRMHLPTTYQYLIDAGLRHDYSMGYANVLGFRAGTSRSYRWYDIATDSVTDLTVHPFSIMDVTLRRASNGNINKAIELARQMIDLIREINGTLGLVWHNSSFYDTEGWEDWDKVYEEILRYSQV